MLASLLMSVVSGGATGLLGILFQRGFDFLHQRELNKQKAQDQAFEIEKRKIDIQVTQAEWSGRVKVAETEGATASDVAASNAFAASMFKEPERYSSGTMTTGQNWVLVLLDFCRGIVRPALTVYLCALTTYIWWQVKQLLSVEDLEPTDVLEVWKLVVNTILYLTTTCILWWFGTRNKQEQPKLR